MRRLTSGLVVLVALAVVVASCGPGRSNTSVRVSGKRPNIVFLLTDDLDTQEIAYMPNVRRLLTDEGVTFSHFYVSVSLCCPSRSSILRGQYSHNTGVLTNGSGNGGFETAYRLGIEKSTIGTWMQKAGYRTAYIGKYLNAYPDTAGDHYEPPGWNEFASAVAGTPYSEYDYLLNENTHLVAYRGAPRDYGTSVYVGLADHFIRREHDKPFFIYLNVYAPHGPATPAPQDLHLFPRAKAPRTPAFNDANENGKPPWLLGRHQLSARAIAGLDALFRNRIRSLQAVDRGVANLLDTLRDTHQLANTYFVFSSDNGFHLGQFRLPAGKETAYDTDIRVPLIVRGPDVPRHRVCNFIFGNIDLAPTFARLGDAAVPNFVDGRSFVAQMRDPTVDPHPRHSYLVEHWKESVTEHLGSGPTEPGDLDATQRVITAAPGVPPPRPDLIPEFHGVRTDHYLYVEYPRGVRELYDTDHDPFELHNLVAQPSELKLVARLHTLVGELKACGEAECRRLENEPVRAREPRRAPVAAALRRERFEAEPAAHLRTPKRRQRRRGLPTRRHLVEQRLGDVGDLQRRGFHDACDVDARTRHPGHLADVLAGGRLDLLTRRRRLETAKLGDVSAHDASLDRTRNGPGGFPGPLAFPTYVGFLGLPGTVDRKRFGRRARRARNLGVVGPGLRTGRDIHETEDRARLRLLVQAHDRARHNRRSGRVTNRHVQDVDVVGLHVVPVERRLDVDHVRGRRVVRLVVHVHRLLGGQTVTQVRLSRTVLGALTSAEEGGDSNSDQDGNDQNDHHQLDEGEAFLVVPTTRAQAGDKAHGFFPSEEVNHPARPVTGCRADTCGGGPTLAKGVASDLSAHGTGYLNVANGTDQSWGGRNLSGRSSSRRPGVFAHRVRACYPFSRAESSRL